MIVYLKGYADTEDTIGYCPYCGTERPEIQEDGSIQCSCGREYTVIYPEGTMGRRYCRKGYPYIPPEHW